MAKTIMVDIDNTIADYTNGLRDYIRECGRDEANARVRSRRPTISRWPSDGRSAGIRKRSRGGIRAPSPTACTPEKNPSREPPEP